MLRWADPNHTQRIGWAAWRQENRRGDVSRTRVPMAGTRGFSWRERRCWTRRRTPLSGVDAPGATGDGGGDTEEADGLMGGTKLGYDETE